MGVYDDVPAGADGGPTAAVVDSLIDQHGGVHGLIAHLEAQGLGVAVKSWVGPGSNIPITPDQVHEAFRNSTLLALAARAGLRPQQLAQKLAQVLPQAIDRLSQADPALQDLGKKHG